MARGQLAGRLEIKSPRFCFTVAGIESIAVEPPQFCLDHLDLVVELSRLRNRLDFARKQPQSLTVCLDSLDFVAGIESIAMEPTRFCLDRLDFEAGI